MSELVAAFFLSELATAMLTDASVPFLRGIFSIALLIFLEFSVSACAIKIPLVKKMVDFKPDVLIRDGCVLEKKLLKNRITLDELLSMLRQCGYYDITTVRFAIIEPNGQLSVIPYEKYDVVIRNDLNLTVNEAGYTVAVIDDGVINDKALAVIGKSRRWLMDILRQNKISKAEDVFFLASNFNGEVRVFPKA